MVKLGIGAVVAAIAMFMWGFVYWGTGIVDLFTHMTPQAETALSEALKTNLTSDGVYFVPEPNIGTTEEWQQRMSQGPLAMINYRAEGAAPMTTTMGLGFVHMLVTAFLIGLLLQMLLPVAPGYFERVKLVAAVGFVAVFQAHVGQPIWWHWPWSHAVLGSIYDFVSYLIAGAVLAYFVAPKKA
jgi:hypothetical protein